MNNIKTLVFKYFCGYVFFFISLEYMPGGRIVCLSFLFAMATQVPGWVIQFLLWKSLEEMVNQITKGCFM